MSRSRSHALDAFGLPELDIIEVEDTDMTAESQPFLVPLPCIETGPESIDLTVDTPHPPNAWFDQNGVSRHQKPNEEKRKNELWSIVNAFQHSPNFGVYVCESFRDPRRTQIDDYWHEVQKDAVGIHEVGSCIGRYKEPISDNAKKQFRRLEAVLRSLADRVDRALA